MSCTITAHNRSESRTLTEGQTKDLTYQRTDHYLWAPGSVSGSGSGTGSASGSAVSPWRLTQIEESGNATATRGLSYDYSGSGSSWSTWGDFSMGGTHDESWDGVRSIRQQSTASETLSRTITWNDQGEQLTTGSDSRSASATGSADSLYHRQWEDHWWVYEETWASGGTYQNSTYDDYNYQYRCAKTWVPDQYQWTKTWQGQGDGAVSSSTTNHVTGLESGSESGWWTHFVAEGSGGGYSSSSSWGGPLSNSYDETITYPGFYDYRYYGRDYGGGSGEEDYIAYVGDVFYESPGSDGGFFLFAYSEDQLLFAGAAGDRAEEQRISVPAGVPGTERVSVLQQEHQYYFGTEGGSGKNGISAMAANETVGRAQGGQVRAQGEAAGGGAQGLPEWRWWNPFTWFGWGIDWSEAVDQEIELVRQLNQTFGTAHTRLDQFTAEERARIEQALGRKFNWEQASAIRASERELQIRDKVLLGSQVSLAAAGVADAAAGGVAASGVSTKVAIHGAHHSFGPLGRLAHIQINWWRAGVKRSGRVLRIPLPWR